MHGRINCRPWRLIILITLLSFTLGFNGCVQRVKRAGSKIRSRPCKCDHFNLALPLCSDHFSLIHSRIQLPRLPGSVAAFMGRILPSALVSLEETP